MATAELLVGFVVGIFAGLALTSQAIRIAKSTFDEACRLRRAAMMQLAQADQMTHAALRHWAHSRDRKPRLLVDNTKTGAGEQPRGD